MDVGLEGKTVIVTGAASNIGRAIALAFAQEKCNIVISDIDEEGAKLVAKRVKEYGAKALVVKTDITKPDQVEAMAKKAKDTFGSVDVLVNDAAIMQIAPFIETTYEDWQKMAAVNVFGTSLCCKAVLPYMIEQKKGAIVSIGSDAGRIGENRQAFYSGTKGHVIALTKGIAKEVGRYGIRVNCVCPGATIPSGEAKRGFWKDAPDIEPPPEMIKQYPLRRMSKPEDIADVVVFLASDRAGFITGQILSVSGGFSMV